MRLGLFPGVVAGAALALAIGFSIAVLPSTPTWTLWKIKRALDRNDLAELQELVDLPQAAARAVGEIASGSARKQEAGLDYRSMAAALFGGGKVYTVFNDPENPVRLDAGHLVAAWWRMRRDGDEATVSVDVDGRPISLVFGRVEDGTWRVVGLSPLSALIRVKPSRAKDAGRAQR